MTPIFIITCDRITALKSAIESYESRIGEEIEIVIHDNDSTFPEMVEWLNDFEAKGGRVYRRGQKKKPGQLNDISLSIEHYFMTSKNPVNYYIVTDCDIILNNTNKDILDVYRYILGINSNFKCVGPMLEIGDIPNHYPLKGRVISRHNYAFWRKKPFIFKFKGEEYKAIGSNFDTTFVMYKRLIKFKRLTSGIRVHPPYSAKHLDWYLDPNNMTEDQIHYASRAPAGLSHWSKIFKS